MTFPKIVFLLCQDSAFDSQASLALQLEEQRIAFDFVWPFESGVLQGDYAAAQRAIEKFNDQWEILSFASQREWDEYSTTCQSEKAIVFPQTPYLNDHFAGSTIGFLKNQKMGYVSYGVNILDESDLSFGLEVYKEFSPILVSNEIERQKFLAHGINDRNLVVTGSPGPYQVHYLTEYPSDAIQTEVKTLLWAPHWIDGWSTWEESIPVLNAFAKTNPDVLIRVRAHPLFSKISKKPLPDGYQLTKSKKQESNELLSSFLNLDNVVLSTASMTQDCLTSTWLLTDGLSILVYWAATGKPMALTQKKQSPIISSEYRAINEIAQTLQVDQPEKVHLWLEERMCELEERQSIPEIKLTMKSWSLNFFDKNKSPGAFFADWLGSN